MGWPAGAPGPCGTGQQRGGGMSKKSTAPILLVDSPERAADLRYASGFWAPDPVVFLDTGSRAFLVVSTLEQGRAQALARRQRGRLVVHTPDTLTLKGRQRRSVGEWTLALLRREGVRQVRVPAAFPLGTARLLEARGIRLALADSPLYPGRLVKTTAELANITESQRAAVAAMRAAVACLRASAIGVDGVLRAGTRVLTAEAVKQVIHETLLRHETVCREVIVAGGAQGADPHERGHGPLRGGTPIVIDIFPQHMNHGYWGDLTRTVVRGRATPAVRRQYRAVKAAQRAALSRIRAGVELGGVHAAAAQALAAAGFQTGVVDGSPEGFIHSTGHGLGLEIHEAPSLAPVDGCLRAGEVVTVEPGLYYRAQGGIRIEDTVCVTRTGCRVLVPCPHVFELGA